MSEVVSAEQLAQRALDVGIVDDRQLQSVWSEFGTTNVGVSEFTQALMRKNLLTSYQLERLTKNLRTGFYYGDYRVLYCVGSGTFARVFRAVHRDTGEVFAVKVLRARHSTPRDAELFRREGQLGASLKHPNIVPIHEVVSQGGNHFMVMDFVEGRNLREFLRVRKKFEPIEAAEIVVGMTSGLHYAFQQGVTHRDLKLSNVIVSSAGVAMLLDFGLAGLEADAEDEGANPRTIDYAGLERATGVRKDDTRSDIFFVGCMFYQLLSGRPPLSETRERAQRLSKTRYQSIPPLGSVVAGVPTSIAMVVGKATEFEPGRRYQTPGEMLTDLKLAIHRIKSGTEAETGPQNAELLSREGLDAGGQPRRIMVVESDVKRQDVMRELFKRNGYRVLVTADPQRAVDRFAQDPNAADIVLFCSAAGGRATLQAFNQFGEASTTRDTPAVLLLDELHGPWAKEAATASHRRLAQMPIKLRQLRETVLMALTPSAG
ncbi:Serine/threonine-protein kinase PknB [Pirellulimonas nuda]|uniref:Serine/threonine-protein kinase PknB n=1 Tax=Pirellulimonas nuda TaxID=2528009 RepID=A0A518DBD9_9BACT|nr:serine/threonine-protein kinase [Pirellulimonas nuda]QDU88789.1 Serine/threonine-protein kinase PknB [Pirellulimonas nuda]